MHHVSLHKNGPCNLLVLVVYLFRYNPCDNRHHERSQTCIPTVHSSNQMRVSGMYKRLTSMGIKDLGMTLQSREEGKQKGTSVYSTKQSSR